VTLTDAGNVALTITGITVSGDFVETNTCGGSLAAGTNCKISVTFKPTATGTRTGVVSITDNTSGSPQTISLKGTGAAAMAMASVSPASLSFGNLNVGSTSTPQTVTLSNTGSGTLIINSMSIDKNFAESNTCGTSLNAAANCTISVTFSPTTPAGYAGMLTISDNAGNSPQTVNLTGTGLGPQAQLSPTTLTFGSQTVNSTSTAQAVTMTNTGNAALTITGITVSGDFAETNTCGGSLAAGANCRISGTFKPTASGTRAGTLGIADNAAGSPQSVALTGSGSPGSAGDFSLSTSSGSVTIAAGQTATFSIAVTSTGGFNQAVNLTCLGAPQGAACSISPSSVTPSGTTSSATVTVTTSTHSIFSPPQGPEPFLPYVGLRVATLLVSMLAFVLLLFVFLARQRRMRFVVGFATVLVMLVGAGCSGIVQSGLAKPSTGTPAGTYNLTVSGASGTNPNTLTHSTNVTLTVN
jgi:hypothetical protein